MNLLPIVYIYLFQEALLFLPAAVGIIDKFNVIAPYLLPICLILLFAVILNIAVIALVVQFIKRHYEGDFPE